MPAEDLKPAGGDTAGGADELIAPLAYAPPEPAPRDALRPRRHHLGIAAALLAVATIAWFLLGARVLEDLEGVEESVALGMIADRLGHAIEGLEEVEEIGVHLPMGVATPTSLVHSSRRRIGPNLAGSKAVGACLA